MSFLGGPECSAGANPLASLMKQQNTDRSLQANDQFQDPMQRQRGSGFRSQAQPNVSMNPGLHGIGGPREQEAFLEGTMGIHTKPSSFDMEGMQKELDAAMASAWGRAQNLPGPTAPMSAMSEQHLGNMRDEYTKFLQSTGLPLSQNGEFRSTQQPGMQSGMSYPFMNGPGGMSSMMMNRPYMPSMFGSSFGSSIPISERLANGDRFTELESAGENATAWDDAFAQVEKSAAAEKTAEKQNQQTEVPPTSDDRAQAEAAKARVDQAQSLKPGDYVEQLKNIVESEQNIGDDLDEADKQLLNGLETAWKQMEQNFANDAYAEQALKDWEAQFGSQVNGADDFDLDEAYEGSRFGPTPEKLAEEAAPAFSYSQDNPFDEASDPYQEGLRLMREGAPLVEVSLAFEAACRREPDRAEVWLAAAETFAADEREDKALNAFQHATHCNDGSAASLSSWLGLAVSYVNENLDQNAVASLERWLQLAYPSIPPTDLSTLDPSNPWARQQAAIDRLIDALHAGPSARARRDGDGLDESHDIDPDLQIALGILAYSMADFEKARDSFEVAVTLRPNDFLLWNRYGATLANGGQPEAAIAAYRHALELRPTFTRCIYNLGVSCLNIGCHKEAAEHLLAAIDGQRATEKYVSNRSSANAQPNANHDSSSLWMTLRRAIMCLDDTTLAHKCVPGTDLQIFRDAGFEW